MNIGFLPNKVFNMDHIHKYYFNNFRSNCTDGYLKIFLKGQETQDAYDKFDYELCGYDIPHYVVSDGPRLAMVFSSGELQARGFKVNSLKRMMYPTNTILLLNKINILGKIYIRNGIQNTRYSSTRRILCIHIQKYIA